MRMPGSRSTYSQPVVQETDSLSARVTSSLRAFHVHARDCHHCADPYAVSLSPTKQLCDAGHALAQEIALNLYSKARTTPQGMIEVTFPEGWESVNGLIRAITHKLQGEPTNFINIADHDAHRSTLAREATTTGKVHYVPASRPEQPLNRGSGYARDVSHRTGESPRRQSSHHEQSSSRRHARSDDPRTSSLNLIEPRRSPSPTSSSGSHHRRTEEAPRQQLVRANSMRQNGPRVAFNPEVETRYF
ncbi:hypothetical protein Q9L58_002218 [Maublancomyces gigas]|uniref:Uncharacterized protein n=1 Tax=Discina gigas TaxID=1032678 RepID=A0ABR3GSA5_9PEZI